MLGEPLLTEYDSRLVGSVHGEPGNIGSLRRLGDVEDSLQVDVDIEKLKVGDHWQLLLHGRRGLYVGHKPGIDYFVAVDEEHVGVWLFALPAFRHTTGAGTCWCGRIGHGEAELRAWRFP